MIIQEQEVQFNPDDPKNMAQALFNIFLYTYTNAIASKIYIESKIVAMKAANKAYEDECSKHGPIGFCMNHPFTDEILQQKQKELDFVNINLIESQAMMLFIRDRFLEGIDLTPIQPMIEVSSSKQ